VTAQLGNWVQRGDFPGTPRSGSFVFTIGNTAYIGAGFHGGPSGLEYVNTSWSFNQEANLWTQIAAFPGIPREKAVAFSINGKGYVGTGYNRAQDTVTYIPLKDFWEYDPATNQWKKLSDFGGGARFNAVGFASNNNGYVGTGYNGNEYFGDFWRYDPAEDTWHAMASYDGGKVERAVIMPIGSKFYLLSGFKDNSYVYKMWQFDPEASGGTWSAATPLVTDAQYGNFKIAVARYDAVAFGLDGKGYIATGISGPATNSVYQYDPAQLTWTKMTPYERAARSQAVAFVVGGRAYVGTGQNGNRFDNMDEFLPTADYDAND